MWLFSKKGNVYFSQVFNTKWQESFQIPIKNMTLKTTLINQSNTEYSEQKNMGNTDIFSVSFSVIHKT